MKVFKFGGASIRSAKAIQQVISILQANAHEKLLVVVSAMGNTTDALEQIVALSQSAKNIEQALGQINSYHLGIIEELLGPNHKVNKELGALIDQIRAASQKKADYDQVYDQVVSLGEVISSIIIHHALTEQGIKSSWLDARQFIRTDTTFREGKIEWDETRKKIKPLAALTGAVLLTQGFIGAASNGLTTTLGREGSDFSGAIFAACLSAESLTIWKDVAGVMNADPKRLPSAKIFDELPFKEAAEMTYYGASIIHPKTIKPLANLGIPLRVKSFVDPNLPGTIIHECIIDRLPPLIVFKENQCLVSCQVTDYSFINEQQIAQIFETVSTHNLKINVMQNSAISFSFCVDFRERKVLQLIETLGKKFEVFYNTGLTLITIKNYDQKLYEEYRQRGGILLEQSSRSTLQILVKQR
jgi:aspartate kinase